MPIDQGHYSVLGPMPLPPRSRHASAATVEEVEREVTAMPNSDTSVVSPITAAPLPDKIPLAEARAAGRFGHDKPTGCAT